MSYFTDPWNLLDSAQFIFFTLLFVIKFGTQFTSDTFVEILLQALLLIQTFNKCFYFLRVNERFSYLFIMTNLLIGDTIPYLIVVIPWSMSICMQYTSLHISVNDPKG